MARSFRRVAAALVLVGSPTCAVSHRVEPDQAGRTARPDGASHGARNLFAEPWDWIDETGANVRFDAWRGFPILVAMVFTDCTAACPLTIEKLRRASDALVRENRPASIALVTLDPANDTPERLRQFKASRQLPAAWHLLRGGDAETRELADLLQIHVVENAHIFHDSWIVAFDGDGRLLGQVRDGS